VLKIGGKEAMVFISDWVLGTGKETAKTSPRLKANQSPKSALLCKIGN